MMAISTFSQLYRTDDKAENTATISLYRFDQPSLREVYTFGREGLPDLPDDQYYMRYHHVQISPDQNWLAFSLTREGVPEITVVDLVTHQANVLLNLPKTSFVDWLFWSPDGQWVGVVYFPNPNIPNWKTIFISVDGSKKVDTNCTSVEAWEPITGAFYCVKERRKSTLYLTHLPSATEKVVPWPDRKLFEAGGANFNYIRLFPEINGAVIEDTDKHILYWGSNLHLLIGDAVTNQSVKEFIDGMEKILEYPSDEVSIRAVELSPDAKELFIRGADRNGFGKGVSVPVTFTHVYTIGGVPLNYSQQTFFNDLWGIAWSPDGDHILAFTGLMDSWGPLPPLEWGADLVMVDSETFEIAWTLSKERNGKLILDNIFTISSELTNFDLDW